ncbi:unnamed protein product [Owenia fusiformis]|uniref:Uncharacterized protein n=1 Tax=Owenia fusiformis TaxID=6347 RepID=A0A8S4N041_OWEFU|nr:unnamed protein product [Owenia fusiformis]
MRVFLLPLVLLACAACSIDAYGSGSGSGSGSYGDDEDSEESGEIEESVEVINENAFCSNGWESFRGKCYYFGRADLNFTKARSFCQGVDSDLVVIGSRLESNYITKKVTEHKLGWAWIGLTDAETEGQWKTVEGNQLKFKNWQDGSPSQWRGDTTDCAHIGFIPYVPHGRGVDKWKTIQCSQDLPFICEKSASEFSTLFQQCKVTGLGAEYMGNETKTKSGKPCLDWEKAVGSNKEWLKAVDWPKCRGCKAEKAETPKAKNSCRNPDSTEFGPWCFTDLKGTKEMCDVPFCEGQDENIKTVSDTYSGKEYTFVLPPTLMTYRTASAFCNSRGGAKLLMIDNEEEDMWVAKVMVKLGQRRSLIGITDDLWEWDWRTQDGEDFYRWKEYHNWGYREPTTIGGETQDCNYVDVDFLIDPAMLPSAKKPYWADTTCNTPLNVICEKPLAGKGKETKI